MLDPITLIFIAVCSILLVVGVGLVGLWRYRFIYTSITKRVWEKEK